MRLSGVGILRRAKSERYRPPAQAAALDHGNELSQNEERIC